MPVHPVQHRSHDYRLLIKRWQALAKNAGLAMRAFARAGEHSVYAITNRSLEAAKGGGIYLSAGVHGDEPAPPWGLLEWAEENVRELQSRPFLIFPTLNPAGLTLNTRADHRGVDINRMFHDDREPLIAAWRGVIGERRFSLALCLHEDYDGQGCYVYELTHRKGSVGGRILEDTAGIIPTDPRRRIDGRAAVDGLIIRRVPPDLPGYPEAIMLHYLGVPITLTFESPSEFCLTDRVAVQKRFIASSLKHVPGL